MKYLIVAGRRVRPGKILCVVRNYAAHARESGAAVPQTPVFFLKPITALIPSGGTVLLPPESARVEVECELAVVLSGGGRDIPPTEAVGHILGYAVFFDITARDLQAKAKQEGLPWTTAKGFDTFAPISDVARASRVPEPMSLGITLTGNGEVWQDGTTRDMVHRIPDLVHHASRVMSLEKGDVLATGTPAGVHVIQPGDMLVGTIERVGRLVARVGARGKA